MVLSLLGAGEQLTAALGDGEALFQQASRLAQTATALVEVLKNSHDILGAAGISESEVNFRANLLSQAISDLLESLKVTSTLHILACIRISCPGQRTFGRRLKTGGEGGETCTTGTETFLAMSDCQKCHSPVGVGSEVLFQCNFKARTIPLGFVRQALLTFRAKGFHSLL